MRSVEKNELHCDVLDLCLFKSRATQLYTPLCQSVGPSVGPSVTLYFFGFLRFLVADTRLPLAVSVGRSVSRSVRPSVHPSIRHISKFQAVFALLLLPNRPTDLPVVSVVTLKLKSLSQAVMTCHVLHSLLDCSFRVVRGLLRGCNKFDTFIAYICSTLGFCYEKIDISAT